MYLLNPNCQLYELCIEKARIQMKGAIVLFKAIAKSNQLKVLRMSGNLIGSQIDLTNSILKVNGKLFIESMS